MKTNKILVVLGIAVAFCALWSVLVPGVCAASLAVVSVLTGLSGGGASSGTRATASGLGLESNSRVINMDNKIYVLDPNKSKLIACLQKFRKDEATANPKVEWLEDEYLPNSGTTSASVASASTSTTIGMTTGHGAFFRDRDVVKDLATGQVLYVTSVSTDTLSVKRLGGATSLSPLPTAVADIPSGSTLLVLGNASEENATGRVIKSTVKVPKKNFTQIFREPYGSSRTLANSKLYGGKDMPYQARMAGIRHEMNMERQFLFGEMAESLSGTLAVTDPAFSGGSYPLRLMGGLEQFITTNVTTDTTMTEDGLESFMETGLRYGGEEKIAVVSRKVMSYINLIAKNRLQTFPTTREFPLKIITYISGHGEMKFLVHHQFDGPAYSATLNPNVRYKGYMFLLDFDNLAYVPFEGADTIINRAIQANDVDGKVDEFLTECTLKLIHERQHALWRGIQGYA